jgi:hypothetical protein
VGHRVSSFAGDCVAIGGNQCRVTVDKPGGEFSTVTFYPGPALSAEQVRQIVAEILNLISRSFHNVVSPPRNGNPPKTPAQLLMPPQIPPAAGNVGGFWAGDQKIVNGVPIITPPPTDKLVQAAKGKLVGSDGGTLIGSDGATLIGNDGTTIGLIGNDGTTRRGALAVASAKKKKKKKPKAKTVVLGTYVMPTDGSSIQPVLRLTPAGRKLLAKIGALNRKRKRKIVPNTSFLQVFQPEDKVGTGGAVTNIKLK